jgi:hypothetical protein
MMQLKLRSSTKTLVDAVVINSEFSLDTARVASTGYEGAARKQHPEGVIPDMVTLEEQGFQRISVKPGV